MVNETRSALRERLRADLTGAIKGRDKATAGVLRVALAALENAEAVDLAAGADRNLAIEQIPVGAGATEARRRALTEAQELELLAAEMAERESAAEQYDRAGQSARAEQLRAESRVLAAYLG
jgi:uncharacterized protein YqeY